MLGQTKELLGWAFSERNVRLVWIGRTCAFLAEQVGEIALVWFTWQMTHSSAQVGLVALLVRMPFWAFGWLAGIYADRFPQKTIITGANLAGAAIALLIPLLHGFGWLNASNLAVLAFLFTLSRAAELPAVSAQLPGLVPAGRLWMMNTVLDNTKRLGRMAGPLLAALLQLFLPVPSLYVAAALALGVMACCSHSFSVHNPVRIAPSSRIADDVRVGWRELRADRPLFYTILCCVLYNPVYAVAYWVLLPRFCSMEMGGGGSLYSMAIALFNAGALASNIMLGISGVRSVRRGLLLGFLILGCSLSLLSLATSAWGVFLLVALAATGLPLMDIGVAALINERIARGHQGKVFTLFRYGVEVGLAVGLLGGALLAGTFGSRASFALLGVYTVPVVAVFAWVLRERPRPRAGAGKASG